MSKPGQDMIASKSFLNSLMRSTARIAAVLLVSLLLTPLVTPLTATLALANDDPVIMVFGDSLSAAYGIREEQGWVTLLQEKLTHEGYPHQVINASVSGETTTGGLTRLPASLSANQPDLVILELGGNDGLRGLPIQALEDNLQKMVDLIQASGAEVLLVGIQIPPNYGPRYTVPFAEVFPTLAERESLPLVPFLIDGIAQRSELMQNDGIHPKAEAQPMIVDNVWPVLEPLLQP